MTIVFVYLLVVRVTAPGALRTTGHNLPQFLYFPFQSLVFVKLPMFLFFDVTFTLLPTFITTAFYSSFLIIVMCDWLAIPFVSLVLNHSISALAFPTILGGVSPSLTAGSNFPVTTGRLEHYYRTTLKMKRFKPQSRWNPSNLDS